MSHSGAQIDREDYGFNEANALQLESRYVRQPHRRLDPEALVYPATLDAKPDSLRQIRHHRPPAQRLAVHKDVHAAVLHQQTDQVPRAAPALVSVYTPLTAARVGRGVGAAVSPGRRFTVPCRIGICRLQRRHADKQTSVYETIFKIPILPVSAHQTHRQIGAVGPGTDPAVRDCPAPEGVLISLGKGEAVGRDGGTTTGKMNKLFTKIKSNCCCN